MQQKDGQTISVQGSYKTLNSKMLCRLTKANISGFIELYDKQLEWFLENTSQIQVWSVNKLSINGNRKIILFSNLQNIKFCSLKILALANNNIKSIQGISRLDAPCLVKLNLQRNDIVNLSDLRKISSSSITALDLTQNKIQEASFFSETNWPLYQYLTLQITRTNYRQIQNLSFLAKLKINSEKVKKINLIISSKYRITEDNKYKNLGRKIPIQLTTKARKFLCDQNSIQNQEEYYQGDSYDEQRSQE